MKRGLAGLTLAGIMCVTLFGATAANASQSVSWTGNGLDSIRQCVNGVDQPYLHWVLTPGGKPVEGTTAELFINGNDMGTMVPVGAQGALQLTISVSAKLTLDQLKSAEIHADILTGSVGESAVLTISDGCLCNFSSS
jgi:hypothetical protein